MDFTLLLRGLILGVSIAAPVGPIGVLCIRRALTDGRRYAFISGLGAATADALYGSIAGLGMSFISSVLLSHHFWLQSIGGLYLCYLGYKTCMSTPGDHPAGNKPQNLLAAYSSTCLLTLTNPMTIFACMAIFAGLGIADTTRSYSAASVVVLGVFSGSALWWLLLSSAVDFFRSWINLRHMVWINTISGAIIVGFGVLALLSLWG